MDAEIRILVVDDEAAERITLGEVLRLEGYQVTLAASGEEALALARAAEEPYELAILDLRLPGADGLQVLEGIRQLSPETVAILITGYGTLETAVQALRKGAFDFLLKPCPVDEVLKAAETGKLQEVFGSGTAAVVSPVGQIKYGDRAVTVGNGQVGPLAKRFYTAITDIQYGRAADPKGWVVPVV